MKSLQLIQHFYKYFVIILLEGFYFIGYFVRTI